MVKPIGQEEDDAAFLEILEEWRGEFRRVGAVPLTLWVEDRLRMRFAFDAGMKRGLEKRA